MASIEGHAAKALAALDRGGGKVLEAATVATDQLLGSAAIAAGQGALGIEARGDAREVCAMLAKLNHAETRTALNAERALLDELQGKTAKETARKRRK